MTTPTGAADERERLLKYVEDEAGCDNPEWYRSLEEVCAMARADAETIQELSQQCAEGLSQVVIKMLENRQRQLAAQSAELDGWVEVAKQAQAELERVRKLANDCREWVAEFPCRENGKPQPGQNELLDRIDDLAAPSAAGGEKEG